MQGISILSLLSKSAIVLEIFNILLYVLILKLYLAYNFSNRIFPSLFNVQYLFICLEFFLKSFFLNIPS